jgi:hypothetical protein
VAEYVEYTILNPPKFQEFVQHLAATTEIELTLDGPLFKGYVRHLGHGKLNGTFYEPERVRADLFVFDFIVESSESGKLFVGRVSLIENTAVLAPWDMSPVEIRRARARELLGELYSLIRSTTNKRKVSEVIELLGGSPPTPNEESDAP